MKPVPNKLDSGNEANLELRSKDNEESRSNNNEEWGIVPIIICLEGLNINDTANFDGK